MALCSIVYQKKGGRWSMAPSIGISSNLQYQIFSNSCGVSQHRLSNLSPDENKSFTPLATGSWSELALELMSRASCQVLEQRHHNRGPNTGSPAPRERKRAKEKKNNKNLKLARELLIKGDYLSCPKCCIFWPAFECCAPKILVEIFIFSMFVLKSWKNAKSNKFGAKFWFF